MTARRKAPLLAADQRQRLERDLSAERNRARMERVAAIRHRAAGDSDSAQACDDRARDAEEVADRIKTVLDRFTAPPRKTSPAKRHYR